MFPRRKLRAGLGVLLLAGTALLSACTAGSTDTGGGGDSALPHVRIAIGIDQAYAPFFVAKDEGLFQRHGVDVELVQFAVGGDGVDSLATDQTQMAASSEVTAIAKLIQLPDLRAMLVYEQSGDYLKVVTRSGITDPAQIKKMAVVPGLSEVSAVKFLQAKNIDPASVQFITAGAAEIPTLVQRGDADAFVLWEPWPTKAVEQGSKIVSTTGQYGWQYTHWLMTTNKWLQSNQQTAAKVARALDEAAQLVHSDPNLAAKDTEKEAKIPPQQTLDTIKEITFQVRDITAADLPVYDSVAQFYVGRGVLKSKPDVATAALVGWYSAHGTSG